MTRKKWMIAAGLIVTLQWSGFYLMDLYLTPTGDSLSTVASASSQALEKQVQPPEDALLYDIDRKGKRIAYYEREQLVIKDRKDQIVSITELKGVHFIQWLDNGDTVFYVRNIDGKNEIGVYKVPASKTVPLYDIASTRVSIEKVYYSSYVQMMFVLYQQDKQLRVASYEAIFGWKSRPLTGIIPQDSWLDEKTAVLSIKDQHGKVWTFKREDFTDPQPKAGTSAKNGMDKQEDPAKYLK